MLVLGSPSEPSFISSYDDLDNDYAEWFLVKYIEFQISVKFIFFFILRY